MVMLTLLLAAALLLSLYYPIINLQADNTTPVILKITSAISPAPTYKSILLLTNIGSEPFANDNYRAEIFRNGKQMDCIIETLNAHNFISTHHTGVQILEGSGCVGYYWNIGARGKFDLSDGSIRPGDIIEVDIFDKTSKTLFSQDTTTV